MKTTTDTMQKPALEATVEVKDDNTPPRQDKTAAIRLGTIAVLLVTLTVIAVITFVQVKRANDKLEVLSDGQKMNREYMMDKDSQVNSDEETVEADITYHLPLLNKTIEEKVVVTNDEEDITTHKIRTIYDYKRGYVVTRIETDGKDDTDVAICYARKFTPQETISRIKASVKAEQRHVVVMNETTTEEYISTDEPFNRNLLSERASAMCQDSQIVLMKPSEAVPDDTEGETAIRKKRACSCHTVCKYWIITHYYACTPGPVCFRRYLVWRCGPVCTC